MGCWGRYCDMVRLKCCDTSNVTTGSEVWSYWFSEEQLRFSCPGDKFITGIECRGRYCDEIRVICSDILDYKRKVCYWSHKFSEENGGTIEYNQDDLKFLGEFRPNFNIDIERTCSFSAGVNCHDRYCDSKQLYVCSVQLELCEPKDAWYEVAAVDNRGSSTPLTYNYERIVGTSESSKFSIGGSQSHTVNTEIAKTLKASYSLKLGYSYKTEHSWRSDAESIFSQQTRNMASIQCPARMKCNIFQVRGSCGRFTVATEHFKTQTTSWNVDKNGRQIKWIKSNFGIWAENCEFSGNDMKWESMPNNGEKCMEICNIDPDCTHFTWTTAYDSGRCYLKREPVQRWNAVALRQQGLTSLCGIVN